MRVVVPVIGRFEKQFADGAASCDFVTRPLSAGPPTLREEG